MKRTLVALTAILVALSLSVVAFAAVKQITGEVISVDHPSKMLWIKAQGKELGFSVENGAAEALPDLKPGDKVTVHYTEADGKLTAQTIRKG